MTSVSSLYIYLQHPVGDKLPHVRLDLLLHVLEVVVVGDVAVLGVHHVAEHPVLQQGGVHLSLTNENTS